MSSQLMIEHYYYVKNGSSSSSNSNSSTSSVALWKIKYLSIVHILIATIVLTSNRYDSLYDNALFE